MKIDILYETLILLEYVKRHHLNMLVFVDPQKMSQELKINCF